MANCYLMLGTNLGERAINLANAVRKIEGSIGNIKMQSSIYESEPWGYEDSLNYYNQAIYLETSLSANVVLSKCLSIEDEMGRERTSETYQARIIDIDILFFDNLLLTTESLIIPHPRIVERRFVLKPLCEIDSEFVHPVTKLTVKEQLKKCVDKSWVKKI